MPRVVPSQVVDLIDRLVPKAEQNTPFLLKVHNSDQLAAVLEMIGQIPNELFVLDGAKYAEFTSSCAAVRGAIQRWHSPEKATRMNDLARVEGLGNLNPVTLIRQALLLCPDEFPAPGTAELSFIPDADLKESLRKDVSAVTNAFTNGEWKAATVLAGSVIEAFLLWALQEKHSPTDISRAVKNLVRTKTLDRDPGSNLEKWDLYHFIEVAADLKVIKQETATQTRLAKNYRNLIHPGRAQRLGQICNRATALTAMAALQHVIDNLTL